MASSLGVDSVMGFTANVDQVKCQYFSNRLFAHLVDYWENLDDSRTDALYDVWALYGDHGGTNSATISEANLVPGNVTVRPATYGIY